jgi:DNA topoisomerase-1
MEKTHRLDLRPCGKPLVIKWGKHGSFLACTGYPECTYTRETTLVADEIGDKREPGGNRGAGRRGVLRELRASDGAQEGALRHVLRLLGLSRLQDDQADRRRAAQAGRAARREVPAVRHQLALKSGRFGEFTACSNYPTCKYVLQKTTGVPCPKCGTGEVAERRSKRGKTFYGCNRYPGVRLRGLVETNRRTLPELRVNLPARKVPEVGPLCGVPEQGMQVPQGT